MDDDKNGTSRVRAFMGQTPKNLKQKFFSVLGTSSEYKKQIISGISNKIDAALSFGSTSETTPENVNEAKVRAKLKKQHEKTTNLVEYSLDDHIVDYELRRVKEKRAYEEILSGCYRHPAFIDRAASAGAAKDCSNIATPHHANATPPPPPPPPLAEPIDEVDQARADSSSSVRSLHDLADTENIVPSPSHNVSNSNNKNNPQIDCTSTTTISHHLTNISLSSNNKNYKALNTKENFLGIASCSAATSGSGSDTNLSLIDCGSSDSSLEVKMWQTESMALAPSCSSIASMEASSDEVTFEFMRRFVTTLFTDSTGITLELKHQFGQYARLAAGRMWFARLVNAQRTQSKKVSETTFYALIQYFAIVLFECKDCEDFLPARYLMSLCFAFYHEVQVPGCEPYREYLFNYLRDQQIWHTLRFWNAALFYALHKDKVPKVATPNIAELDKSCGSVQSINPSVTVNDELLDMKDNKDEEIANQDKRSVSESSVSSSSVSSSYDHNALNGSDISKYKRRMSRSKSSTAIDVDNDNTFDTDEQKKQRNMAFSHLGSLTCNMHAFGLSRDLCCEFVKKQSLILNLTKEHEKTLNENVSRLYRETDPWRE